MAFNRRLRWLFQLTQLWVCDWLLEMRTSLWEELKGDIEKPVFNSTLVGFQRDLACMRKLSQHISVSFFEESYFHIPRVPDLCATVQFSLKFLF